MEIYGLHTRAHNQVFRPLWVGRMRRFRPLPEPIKIAGFNEFRSLTHWEKKRNCHFLRLQKFLPNITIVNVMDDG